MSITCIRVSNMVVVICESRCGYRGELRESSESRYDTIRFFAVLTSLCTDVTYCHVTVVYCVVEEVFGCFYLFCMKMATNSETTSRRSQVLTLAYRFFLYFYDITPLPVSFLWCSEVFYRGVCVVLKLNAVTNNVPEYICQK